MAAKPKPVKAGCRGRSSSDLGPGGGNNHTFDDDAYSLENVLTKEITLRDHLLEQVGQRRI